MIGKIAEIVSKLCPLRNQSAEKIIDNILYVKQYKTEIWDKFTNDEKLECLTYLDGEFINGWYNPTHGTRRGITDVELKFMRPEHIELLKVWNLWKQQNGNYQKL